MKKNVLIIVLAIAVIVIGGGILAYQYNWFGLSLLPNPPANETAGWKTYKGTNQGVSFSLKYPPSWTYQEFSCNIEGVAFCPIENKTGLLNCGVTCSMQDQVVAIFINFVEPGAEPALSPEHKYWKASGVILSTDDNKYKEIYNGMIKTFTNN